MMAKIQVKSTTATMANSIISSPRSPAMPDHNVCILVGRFDISRLPMALLAGAHSRASAQCESGRNPRIGEQGAVARRGVYLDIIDHVGGSARGIGGATGDGQGTVGALAAKDRGHRGRGEIGHILGVCYGCVLHAYGVGRVLGA